MVSYKSFLNQIDIPVERITARLKRTSGQILRQTARTWLRFMLQGVPVETGMAKGALKPLGQFLRVSVPISPTRKPYYSKLEGGIQTITFGEEKSFFEITESDTFYVFEWDTDVLHYYISKYYNGPVSGAELIPLADDEAQQYLIDNLARRIPKTLQGFIDFGTEVG